MTKVIIQPASHQIGRFVDGSRCEVSIQQITFMDICTIHTSLFYNTLAPSNSVEHVIIFSFGVVDG
jgi:hypothetical protein